jgi:hypothetical protein
MGGADLDGSYGTHWDVCYITIWQTATLRDKARTKQRQDNPKDKGKMSAHESKVKENTLFYFPCSKIYCNLVERTSCRHAMVCLNVANEGDSLTADHDWKVAENMRYIE